MKPRSLDGIEVRGDALDKVGRPLAKPRLVAWNDIRPFWGAEEI